MTAIEDLKAAFGDWQAAGAEVEPTRGNILRILEILVATLGPELQWEERASNAEDWSNTSDDAQEEAQEVFFVGPHWAISAVGTLVDALRDLDRGTTPPLLKKKCGRSGAAYATAERKWDDAIDELLAVLRTADLCPEGKSPEQFVADSLRRRGRLRRGKPYTAKVLRNLRSNIKRRKRE